MSVREKARRIILTAVENALQKRHWRHGGYPDEAEAIVRYLERDSLRDALCDLAGTAEPEIRT